MSGVIHNELSVVMVRFLANQSRSYQHNLVCTLNTKHKIVFPCVAAVELPTAWLENEVLTIFAVYNSVRDDNKGSIDCMIESWVNSLIGIVIVVCGGSIRWTYE